MDTYADEVERLRETAAELPRLFSEAVEGAATYAAALAELVENLDTRRNALNERAQHMGAPPIPDPLDAYVRAWDALRAPLVAAARRGPGELAVALGKAARAAADVPGASTPFAAETMGDSARAATALLAWTHHAVDEVHPQDLFSGADPVKSAQLLAALVLDLAGKARPDRDVAEWIASLGVAWAQDGD
ncbi:hypothetical protein ABZ770_42495 [Streptomyces sp. NPDC006654]|uniref:hypothetical protein n=1 Tax=Streptomyces sp. NPDC006654 TaxID=3156897 RepID=UPI0033DB203C